MIDHRVLGGGDEVHDSPREKYSDFRMHVRRIPRDHVVAGLRHAQAAPFGPHPIEVGLDDPRRGGEDCDAHTWPIGDEFGRSGGMS
jgi:hypothetical protein